MSKISPRAGRGALDSLEVFLPAQSPQKFNPLAGAKFMARLRGLFSRVLRLTPVGWPAANVKLPCWQFVRTL
jgi:hypothetical protein